MKNKILYFVVGFMILCSFATNREIQTVTYKPQRPKAVIVKAFEHKYDITKYIESYVKQKCANGWIVKQISLTGTSYNEGETGIVVLEMY